MRKTLSLALCSLMVFAATAFTVPVSAATVSSQVKTCATMIPQAVKKATTKVAVKSVSLSKTSVTLALKKTYTLKATINPTKATNKTIKWSSSNAAIASVNSSGKITANKVGTCTITAKSNNGKAANCKITVKK